MKMEPANNDISASSIISSHGDCDSYGLWGTQKVIEYFLRLKNGDQETDQ